MSELTPEALAMRLNLAEAGRPLDSDLALIAGAMLCEVLYTRGVTAQVVTGIGAVGEQLAAMIPAQNGGSRQAVGRTLLVADRVPPTDVLVDEVRRIQAVRGNTVAHIAVLATDDLVANNTAATLGLHVHAPFRVQPNGLVMPAGRLRPAEIYRSLTSDI